MLTTKLIQVFVTVLSCLFTIANAGSNKESKLWLETNAQKDGVITLPSGLQYKILNKGKGKYHPTIDSPTSCHYHGTLTDGTKFDSSYDRGEPATFSPNQVIKGWTEAMQLMVEGDIWELYIPSDLGYGDRGSPPFIKGGDALIFKMEMIEIQGEKVAAITCDISTFKDCSDREKAFIEKAKDKYSTAEAISNEIARIDKVSQNVSATAKDWAHSRMKILHDMQVAMGANEL